MKVSIVGAGTIGATLGYRIASLDLVDELVLVDIAKDLAVGQALDIEQSVAFMNDAKITAGEYSDTANSDLIIIGAGKPRSPGISRLDLIDINKGIVGSVVKASLEHSPDALLMTMTNPMDVMNYAIWKASGLPRERVIGSGGQLDSARLKTVLAKEFNTSPANIDAYIMGEHGDSQVPVFSRVKVNGESVEFDKDKKDEIYKKTRKTAMDVIEKKGATVFAPINTTVEMVESILKDQKKLFTCSKVLDGEYGKHDVSLGVPVILGKNGIEEVQEWELDAYEQKIFDEAAEKLAEYCKNI